mgnify:CR=1 FL=1|tara:strand:+ start:192 stop:674 length:483 start_codon:yes stop_codon:yes gene_type:complete
MVRDYNLEIDIKPIQNYVWDIAFDTTLGAKKSNVGGWQSTVYWTWPNELKELQTSVEKLIPEYTFQSFWINSNGYGDYNDMHFHEPKRVDGISGVYYVDVPDRNMGAIYFEDGTEYEPKYNKLLLFPSYLKHGVRKNKSKFERVSIAFNYKKITSSGITI